MAAALNMNEMNQLFRMGMRILPRSSANTSSSSLLNTFMSCSRFWMLFYAFWLFFMDMFFTIFPTTFIIITGFTLILHYTRIPTPPVKFTDAVFGMDPNVNLVQDSSDIQAVSAAVQSLGTNAQHYLNSVNNPKQLLKQFADHATTAIQQALLPGGKLNESKDGFNTPTPDLTLEQEILAAIKSDVPNPVIAHRGGGLDVPENCLKAFEYSKEKGCNFVYFDVALTKDNVGVIFHDDDLVRVAGINKRIKHLTWSELKTVDISWGHSQRVKYKGLASVPSLDEAVDFCIKINLKFFINIQDPDPTMVDVICQTFRSHKAMYSMAVVTSFNWILLHSIRRRDPKIIGCLAYPLSHAHYLTPHASASRQPLNPLPYQDYSHASQNPAMYFFELFSSSYDNLIDWLLETFLWWYMGLSAVFIHKDLVSKNLVQEWGSRGIHCFLWLADTPEEKTYLNRNLQVGYLTNTLAHDPVLGKGNGSKHPTQDFSTLSPTLSMSSIPASPPPPSTSNLIPTKEQLKKLQELAAYSNRKEKLK